MKLPVSALLLLFATGSGLSAPVNDGMQIRQPARVRWIVDLKKDFGYQGFQRVKSGKRWKAQQGIAFLTTDEVIVYQVKPGSSVSAEVTGGSPAAFYLQAERRSGRSMYLRPKPGLWQSTSKRDRHRAEKRKKWTPRPILKFLILRP